MKLRAGDALILVDLQNDFLPGGALAVPGGDEVLTPLNQVVDLFHKRKLLIVATRDWHPSNHVSFTTQGGRWPPHCVAGTSGAEFSSALHLPPEVTIISKAAKEDSDAYSGFQGTDLENLLINKEAKRLFIGGLATDYCVLNTVKDALEKEFQVFLLRDAVRAVAPVDGDRAISEMAAAGTRMVFTGDLD